MERHTFNSSLISKALFEDGTLATVLKSGKCYCHAGVSKKTWEEFKVSDSAGNYWNKIIRKNHLSLGETMIDDQFLTDEDFAMFDKIEAEAKAIRDAQEDFFAEGEVVSPSEPMPLVKSASFTSEDRLAVLQKQALDYVASTEIQITSPEMLTKAEEVFKAGRDLEKILSEELVPITKSYYDSWKKAKEEENSVLAPIKDAADKLSKVIYSYRKKLEEIEAQERQRKLEEARREAERERQRQTEELKQQLAAEAKSEVEAAKILTSTEIVAPEIPVFTPRVEILPPKTSGTGVRKKLVAVVDNLEELILHVAEGIKARRSGGSDAGYPPVAALEPVSSVLNGACKGRQEGTFIYNGVRVEDQGGMASTRRKS